MTEHQIVLADPPWRFASNSDAKPGKNARGHYPCMRLEDIAAIDVKSMASRDALLFMWVTVPFARLAFDVMDAWGFTYKSQVVWIKDRIATGYWARNRHEMVYIGRRGKFPCPRPAMFPDSVMQGQQRQHSRKPDALHDAIDAAFPNASKIEMFARERRHGWSAWGNEVDKFAQQGVSREGIAP
jgi:N6-adenosine-specific RNA methylase IME4